MALNFFVCSKTKAPYFRGHLDKWPQSTIFQYGWMDGCVQLLGALECFNRVKNWYRGVRGNAPGTFFAVF